MAATRCRCAAPKLAFELQLAPTQPVLLQGEAGFSRKGPKPEHASYYYSEPQLKVAGTVTRDGKAVAVSGTAWLDHEWSSQVLETNAAGWDWAGINLDDGGALMAFQIRGKDGGKLWAHATLRDAPAASPSTAGPGQLHAAGRWKSPRTGASYPVATTIATGVRAGS
jgi:predicted secreted hydrolase